MPIQQMLLGTGSVAAGGWYLYHGCDTATPSSGSPHTSSDFGRQVRVDSSGNVYAQHSSYNRVNWAKFDNNGRPSMEPHDKWRCMAWWKLW